MCVISPCIGNTHGTLFYWKKKNRQFKLFVTNFNSDVEFHFNCCKTELLKLWRRLISNQRFPIFIFLLFSSILMNYDFQLSITEFFMKNVFYCIEMYHIKLKLCWRNEMSNCMLAFWAISHWTWRIFCLWQQRAKNKIAPPYMY